MRTLRVNSAELPRRRRAFGENLGKKNMLRILKFLMKKIQTPVSIRHHFLFRLLPRLLFNHLYIVASWLKSGICQLSVKLLFYSCKTAIVWKNVTEVAMLTLIITKSGKFC